MKDIKHIFFDLDHTLWDFEKNSALTFQQIFKENNIEIDITLFLKAYTPINFEYWKLYREEKVSKEKLRYGRLKDTFNQLNFVISDKVIDQLSDNYIKNLSNYNHLFKGAIDLLEYLKTKYQLHIITNGFEEVQALKIEKSGIEKYFEQIITSESVGVKKPNPKIFDHALNKVNTQAKNAIMIGDNLEADIFGALNCGIKAIHCNFEDEFVNHKDIISVALLSEIKQYL